jgi:ornithine cyclodeaminase/alanine dehydrogenase-like protein (mu-crystallin family)
VGSRLRQARNASVGRVFDHVGIAVSDLAASERFADCSAARSTPTSPTCSLQRRAATLSPL